MMTAKRLKLGVIQAAALAVVGLAAGVVAGLVGLIWGDGAAAVAAAAARVYPALALLLPGMLLLLNLAPPEPALHASLAGSLLVLLVAGLAGTPAATMFFFVPATNLPVIFGGETPLDLSLALRPLVWGSFWPVLIVTMTGAVILAGWTYRRARTSMSV